MAETPSTMAPLGMKAPDFTLPDPAGKLVSLAEVQGASGLLVMFICNHCPYVKHLAAGLADFGREYQERGIGVVAIAANDADNYPQDGPEAMASEAQERGYTFPYLFDETQGVAKSYTAACTPDFFLFNGDLELVYRGQFDSSRPNSGLPVTGEDLRAAADALLAGEPVSEEQRPSVGCNIKWKAGNEPDYF
jgi:peroxiredoxin